MAHISTLVCDRCGAEKRAPLSEPENGGWGRVEIPKYPSKTSYDLCPSCFNLVQNILKGKAK
jgi:hypothetical protein